MSDEPPKERIWPVFVLAIGVAAFGTWLAFASSPDDVQASAVAEPFITPLPAFEPVAGEAVTLTPFTDARTLTVDLRQERRRGERRVRTRVQFDLVETAPRVEGDLRVWERGYKNVDIATSSNGVPFGADVADEVERLLETARIEVTGHATGEVESTRIVSAEAAQLRQVLSVIRQTLDIAMPRVPREAVRPQESWTWSAPIDVAGPEGGVVEASGNMHVDARVLGYVDTRYLIETSLDGDLLVSITPAEAEGAVGSATASGTGRALAIWHPERGLVRSELRWQQRDEGTETEVRATIVDTAGSTE